jgi:hypothetical protein
MPNIVTLHSTTDFTTAIEHQLHKVRPRNQTKDKVFYQVTMKPIPHEDLEQLFVVGRQASRPFIDIYIRSSFSVMVVDFVINCA